MIGIKQASYRHSYTNFSEYQVIYAHIALSNRAQSLCNYKVSSGDIHLWKIEWNSHSPLTTFERRNFSSDFTIDPLFLFFRSSFLFLIRKTTVLTIHMDNTVNVVPKNGNMREKTSSNV